MSIEIDSSGYPRLKEDKLDFGTVSVDADAKSGNPFHDPATGKFTFAPAGMQIIVGEKLLKGLSTPTRKLFFQRSQITRANQVAARVIEGNLHIVLLRDGRRLDSFAVAPQKGEKGKGTGGEDHPGVLGKPIEVTPVLEDIAREAARLGLEGDKLSKFLQEHGISITGNALQQVEDIVTRKKLDDLVDYLHQALRKRFHKEDQIDRIRIAVGRGYLKKTFAKLDEAQTRIVIHRLQGRGWSEDIVQGAIVPQMPKRLRDVFQNQRRIDKGKEQIKKAQQETPKPQ